MASKNQHVTKRPDGLWQVKGEDSKKATKLFSTQADAIVFGQGVAKKQKSELFIHRPNGKIRARDSYGNDPYPPQG